METTELLTPIKFAHHREIPKEETFCENSFDFVYVLSGECVISRQNDETKYNAGDISLIIPNEQYKIEEISEGHYLRLGIMPDFVIHSIGTLGSFTCDSRKEDLADYSAIRELVSTIASKYLENEYKNRLIIESKLFELLSVLLDKFYHSYSDEEIPQKYEERLRTINEYLDKHFTEPITLSSLAEELYLQPQYLSRFFKTVIHKNFKDYLNEKRLYSAYRLLNFTNDSITQIALHCGFSSVALFSKSFRAYYHISPSEARNNFRTNTDQNINTSNEIKITEKDINTISSQKVNVSVKSTKKSNKKVFNLMNVGLAHNLLSKNFQNILLNAKEDLGFSFVRIKGLVSSSFVPEVPPNYDYYFRDLDTVLSSLNKSNLIPFIELSKLPYNTNGTIYSEAPYSTHGKHFFSTLEAILKHTSENFPQEWTSRWCFEMSINGTESIENYIRDFVHVKELLNKYLPRTKLGGFGFPSGFNPNKELKLLESLRENQIKPDFFTAHFSYQVFHQLKYTHTSTDKSLLLDESKLALKLIHKYFPKAKFFLTEWSSMFVTDLPILYSCYQSAFICQSISELSNIFDLMGYSVLADTSSSTENKLAHPYFWGNGLLDRNAQKHPSYHTLKFINSLGTDKIERGENYIITQNDKDSYRILVYNYSHFKSGNSFKNGENSSFADVYDLFEDTSPLNLNFTLSDLSKGIYRITEHHLNRDCGSLIDVWIDGFKRGNISETEYLMKIMLPTPDRAYFYQNVSEPHKRIFYLEVDNEISTSVKLPPHGVCFLEIVKRY
jgi:xylan 1,4-beta-xylosidase